MRAVVVAVLLLAHVAHADPEDKSELTAASLAVVGSLIGPATIALAVEEGNYAGQPLHDQAVPMLVGGAVAIILGPSLGNWYAGQANSRGLDLRLGGAAAVALGVGIVADNFSLSDDRGSDAGVAIGGLIGLGGLALIATGTVMDVVNAPRAAAKHNLSIAPMIGAKQNGLAVAGTF